MKQMHFELDFGYMLPLPHDLIAHFQQPQSIISVNTLQECVFVEWLQHILGVARDAMRDA